MMRRRPLIIGIAAVVILAAGITALSLWPEPAPIEINGGDGNGTKPAPTELISEQQDNVSSVVFSPRGGTSYTIRRDPASGDCELVGPDAVFPGRPAALRSTHTYATGLTWLTCVTEDATDEQLALFGLDKPVMTWRVNRTDGTSAELMVGAEQAAGTGGRYARRQNSRDVFILSALQSTYLTYSLEELYDLSFFPYPPSTTDEPSWPLIDHVLLERKSGDIIELLRRNEEDVAAAEFGVSSFQLLQPLVGETLEYSVEHIVMVPITTIVPDRIEALLPADLSVYGLDDPDRLTVKEEGGWSGTLLIGRYDAASGGRYVMIEGYDAVLFDPNGDYRFLSADPSELHTRQMWLTDIKLVSSLTFELDGVTRFLRFEHDVDEDDIPTLRGWFDGEEISETNARRLYISALRLMQDGSGDPTIPDALPEYRVTMHFLDGGNDTLELYRIGDSRFLMVLNGASEGFFITRMSLHRALLSRIETLDRGEEIPRL